MISGLGQVLGNLFCHPVPPSEIKQMDYKELLLWNRWIELQQAEYRRAADQARKDDSK